LNSLLFFEVFSFVVPVLGVSIVFLIISKYFVANNGSPILYQSQSHSHSHSHSQSQHIPQQLHQLNQQNQTNQRQEEKKYSTTVPNPLQNSTDVDDMNAITLRFLTGENSAVIRRVSKVMTIQAIKLQIFPTEVNSGKRVIFIYQGRVLLDNDTLMNYPMIADNSFVHCVFTQPNFNSNHVNGRVRRDGEVSVPHVVLFSVLVAFLGCFWGLWIFSGPKLFNSSSVVLLLGLTWAYIYAVRIVFQ